MTDQFNTSVPEVTSDDRLWAALAYVFSPIVPIVLLLLEDKKNRPFIKAHNAQALIFGLLAAVFGGPLSTITFGLASIAFLVVAIMWAVKAYNGGYVNIPIITDFVKKQGWA